MVMVTYLYYNQHKHPEENTAQPDSGNVRIGRIGWRMADRFIAVIAQPHSTSWHERKQASDLCIILLSHSIFFTRRGS